jgi:hypothetical protein
LAIDTALWELHQYYRQVQDAIGLGERDGKRGGTGGACPPLYIVSKQPDITKGELFKLAQLSALPHPKPPKSVVDLVPRDCQLIFIPEKELLFWHMQGGNAHKRTSTA